MDGHGYPSSQTTGHLTMATPFLNGSPCVTPIPDPSDMPFTATTRH